MPRLTELFPSKYLKAEDLNDQRGGYRRVTVEIREVSVQDVGGEDKAVVYFRGKDKGLVLNRTNADELQAILGSDNTDDWPGAVVDLGVERVPYQGKRVPALRVWRPLAAPPAGAPRGPAQAEAGRLRLPPRAAAPPPMSARRRPEPEPEPDPWAEVPDNTPDADEGARDADDIPF